MVISKDLLSGLIFLGIGAFMVVVARDYPTGQLLRMGPGYFPTAIGVLIFAVGVYFSGKAVLKGGEPMPRLYLRPLFFIVAAVLAFALTLERFGLVAATVLLVAIARMASYRPLGWIWTGLLATFLTVMSAVVFRSLLGLPLDLWP